MQKFLGWFVSFFVRLWGRFKRVDNAAQSDGFVTKKYVLSACHFAERICEVSVHAHVDVEAALLAWESAEEEFVARGLRSLPLSDFIDHVSWGVPLANVGVKRAKGEEAMLHARYYRYYCLRARGVKGLHTLLRSEGLIDYEPARRLKDFQS